MRPPPAFRPGLAVVAGLRRRRAAEAQVPGAVLAMTGAIRAGLSLFQALRTAAEETPPPLGKELARCVGEVEKGLSLSEALDGLNQRIPSEDLSMLLWALAMHRRAGGDLVHLCTRLHEIMVERRLLRGKMMAATAQTRLTAAVVFLIPVVLGVALNQLAPEYVGVLFHEPQGIAMLIWAAVMNVVGAISLRRIGAARW